MYIIFEYWKISLASFFTHKWLIYLQIGLKQWYLSLKKVFLLFKWFFLIFFLLTIICQDIILKINIPALIQKKTISPLIPFILLMTMSFWFICTTAAFLFIRRTKCNDPATILKRYFFDYIHLLFIFLCLNYIRFLLLFWAGHKAITTASTVTISSWIISIFLHIYGTLIAYAWLDDSSKRGRFLRVTEKITNMIFYNMPFIILFICIILSINIAIAAILRIYYPGISLYQPLTNFFSYSETATISYWVICAVNYLIFFINHTILVFIYSFYLYKKNHVYTESYLTHDE